MNVYRCLYKGNLGYCCRRHNRTWMFVPELGQADNNVYKNIDFEDLIFTNPCARQFELDNEGRFEKSGITFLFSNPLKKKYKAQTIGGLLFHPVKI